MNSEQLNLHLIPGISGSGKTTIGRHIEHTFSKNGIPTRLVVPHTTRAQRPNEEHGVDYFFHDRQHFLKNTLPAISMSPDWKWNKIGNEYYFNSEQATLPNNAEPVHVLPVAYSVLPEMLDEYGNLPDIRLSTIPIVIPPELRSSWTANVQPLRPNRNLADELDEQDTAIATYGDAFDDIFYPTWSMKTDTDQYTACLQKALKLSKHIIKRSVAI